MWSALQACFHCICNRVGLPRNYEFIDVMGEGSYGVVLKCWKRDTECMVAVKICKTDGWQELQILEEIRSRNLDQHNIVSLLDWFRAPHGIGLVMEHLDIDLLDYVHDTWHQTMPLSDVRCIIKQLAVALGALKTIRVIHADIKLDNIMMVNHRERPLRVKLIDFGLALPTYQARLGMQLQHRMFRAPEVMLGLPITEAIDMWSLGCVMAYMVAGSPAFCGQHPHEIMQCIVHHIGQPADHLLNEGLRTKCHFTRTESGWKIKGCLSRYNPSNNYIHAFKAAYLDYRTEAEISEANQCLDLLMAMLKVDASERITPAEVLMHPFMNDETLSSGSDEDSVSVPGDCINIERDHHSPSPTIPPHTIFVQPTTAENTPEDIENTDSVHSQVIKTSTSVSGTSSNDCEHPATHLKATNIRPAHRSPSPTDPPRTICVQPATAENTGQSDDDHDSTDSVHSQVIKTSTSVSGTSSSDCEHPATHPKATNIRPAHRSPSPTVPPRTICVQPATAENTGQSDNDHDSTDSVHSQVIKTSTLVSGTSSSDCEHPATHPKATNIRPAHRSPSPTDPPRTICVQPATAENTGQSDDDHDSTDSFQAGWKKVTPTVSDTSSSTFEDFPICVKKKLPPPPVTELSSKKNCFRRFFSWMKKTFCPCMTCVDDEKE